MTPDALVLLAHGSPDPDWMRPVLRVAERVRARTDRPVVTATLEHGVDLGAAVAELHAAGRRAIAVVPLFLSPGGRHLKRDVPALVEATRAAWPDVALQLVDALGTDDAVIDALAAAALRRADGG